jgi:hypothetical protein
VIHAINFGVYEINHLGVNLNLLNLKENMATAGRYLLAGFWLKKWSFTHAGRTWPGLGFKGIPL